MKTFFIVLAFFGLSLSSLNANDTDYQLIQPVSIETNELDKSTSFKDIDNDGVEDGVDECDNTPQGIKVDNVGCKLLEDDDKDGISNRDDKCPKTLEGDTVDKTGCLPDADKDGVIDSEDECPDTSNDFVVDSVGCPQTAILKINFQSAKAVISKDSFSQIEVFANFLNENTGYQAIIYGHTDSINTLGNNKKLSQQRANAVMDALINYGVKLTRLTAIGMGSKNPIADNETFEGRAKNRRIEVELLQ